MISAPSKNEAVFDNFFKKLEQRGEELKKGNYSHPLSKHISKNALLKIYEGLLCNRNDVELQLKDSDGNLKRLRLLKFAKERTIQIVPDIDGELILILETKSKKEDYSKNTKTRVDTGSFGRSKICWRIDTPVPIKYRSKVSTGSDQIKGVIYGATISQDLYKKAKIDIPDIPIPIEYSLVSAPYNSKKSGELKITSYTQEAYSNLYRTILTDWKNVRENDIYRMIIGLLNALQILHENKLAHQMIHEGNILVCKDLKGYYIKLVDFANVRPFESADALASSFYDSLEIRIAYQDPKSRYGSFYRINNNCYSQYQLVQLRDQLSLSYLFNKSSEYQRVSPSNDMWALGIILFSMFEGALASEHNFSKLQAYPNPLIRGLLNPIREERFTIQQAQQCFSSLQGILRRSLPVTRVAPAFRRLLSRIVANMRSLESHEIYSELERFITKKELFDIYNYFILQSTSVEEKLCTTSGGLMDLMALRTPQGPNGMPRAVQIVQVEDELVLILETKSKNNKKEKDPDTPVYKGAIKKSKPCWRIDTSTPEPWMSTVATGESNIYKTIKDALQSQALCKSTINENTDIPLPIQAAYIGDPYFNEESGCEKVAIYSPRAISNLQDAIFSYWRNFTENDVYRMTKGLLYAVKIFHKKNLVHQDLHAGNILVFASPQGYYVKVIDFDAMRSVGKYGAQAPIGYEPPELRLAFPDKETLEQFYKQNTDTYGAYLKAKQLKEQRADSKPAVDYKLVDPKNEIFQLGILLCQLFTGISLDFIIPWQIEAIDNPLIRGLLSPKREKRFNISQAQYAFTSYRGSLKRVVLNDVQTLVNDFVNKCNERISVLSTNSHCPAFQNRISSDKLRDIYNYIIHNSKMIQSRLEMKDTSVKRLNLLSLRIEKNKDLPRTIQILQDLTGELILILETKSKNARNVKDPSQKVPLVNESKIKLCWRIDTPRPILWESTMVTGFDSVEKAMQDVNISQVLSKESTDQATPLYSLLGEINRTKKYPKQLKVTTFSPFNRDSSEPKTNALSPPQTNTFTPGFNFMNNQAEQSILKADDNERNSVRPR